MASEALEDSCASSAGAMDAILRASMARAPVMDSYGIPSVETL